MLLFDRQQAYLVGGEDHPIEARGQGLGITGQHKYVSAAAVQSDLEQGLQAAGGTEPAAADQLALVGRVHIRTGLAVKEGPGAAALEPQ